MYSVLACAEPDPSVIGIVSSLLVFICHLHHGIEVFEHGTPLFTSMDEKSALISFRHSVSRMALYLSRKVSAHAETLPGRSVTRASDSIVRTLKPAFCKMARHPSSVGKKNGMV